MNYFYLFIALYLIILVVKCTLTIVKPKLKNLSEESVDLSQVTIVQPICSGDPTLAETLTYNLHANAEVNYLWLVDNTDNVANELTSMLKKDFQHINIKIMHCKDCPEKTNSKLFKLNQGLKTVFTDYVIVLEDSVMLHAETLHDLIVNLKDNDLSTVLPLYSDNGNFWCKLMTQFVNNNSAMIYLPLLWFKKPVAINTMCYAMKLMTIQQLGYFENMLNFLSDDVSLAALFKQKSLNIYQSREQVVSQLNIEDTNQYMILMNRWFLLSKLLLKNYSVIEKVIITFLYGLPPFLFFMIILYSLRDLHYIALPLLLIARLIIIQIIQKIVLNKHNNSNELEQYGFSILSELMQPYHLFQAFAISTIIWKTNLYKVKSNEDFHEV